MEAVDLQTEPIAGKTLVEILGDNSVLIENHQGVIGYSCECVQVQTKMGRITVQGCGLQLNKLSRDQLFIQGEILCVKLQRRG